MGKWMKAIACGLLLCLCISLCGFSAECGEIRERVLRLHILANSDSGEDQQLKLKVRDAVVREAAGLFDGTQDAGEALGRAEDELPRLIAAAQQVVWDEGYDYTVQAKLCHMYFTTRQYETVSLPAGMYDAVRFTIGKGEGKNWWCVVFPPLCLGSVSETTQETALEAGLTENQVSLMTGEDEGYVVKFKAVELLEQFKGWLEGR
mgnify:CR=1 FL=1